MTKQRWTEADAGQLPSVAEQLASWDRLSLREQRHDLIRSGMDPREWTTLRVPTPFEMAPVAAEDEHGGDDRPNDTAAERGPPPIDYRQLVADQRRAQGLPAQLPAATVDFAVRVGAMGGHR